MYFRLLLSCSVLGAVHCLTSESSSKDIDWASLQCPSDNITTLPTPTYGTKERVFMICTELFINAPPQKVYDTLIDFENYHRWNTFTIDVQIPPNVQTPEDDYVGMEMVFTTTGLLPGANTTSDEVLTVLDDDPSKRYLMNAWRSNTLFNGSLSRAEHPNILTSAGRGRTRYVSYETYYLGLATPLIFAIRPQLQTQWDRQGLDLKDFVEGL